MDADSGKVSFRRARTEDVAAIVRLMYEDDLGSQRETFTDPLPDFYFEAFKVIDRDPNNLLTVVELDGEIVGTFHIVFMTYLSHRGSKVAQIEAVRVKRTLRGKRIGERMMRWAIDEARRHGCRRVQLTTDKRRSDAHRFYQRLGFKPTHEGMKLLLVD